MFPGDRWDTQSGSDLYTSTTGPVFVGTSDSCQISFDLACLLRPSQQTIGRVQPPVAGPAVTAESKRSVTALEAEFSGGHIEGQLVSCGEVTDSAFYARWLQVEGGNVQAAKEAILEQCKWRARTTPGGVSKESIANELASAKVFLPGTDVKGRPILLVLGSRHLIRHRKLDETVRLIIYTLDNSASFADAAVNPLGQILCLIDLSGLRLGNLDLEGLKALFRLLQQHFPERLDELWFLKAPFIFWGLWRVLSPLLQEKTRQKIRFMSKFDELRAVMPLEVLPQRYGGKAKLISIADAIAAKHAGKEKAAAALNAQKAIQAAQAKPPSGLGTGRLAAAGGALKRWGIAGFSFIAAKSVAVGQQAARPFSAAIAAYKRRPAKSPASPTLGRRVSARMDSALAKARDISAIMRQAQGLVAGYALGSKAHMGKFLRLPSLVLCALHQAKLVFTWAWHKAVCLAWPCNYSDRATEVHEPGVYMTGPRRVAASAPLRIPPSIFSSEVQQAQSHNSPSSTARETSKLQHLSRTPAGADELETSQSSLQTRLVPIDRGEGPSTESTSGRGGIDVMITDVHLGQLVLQHSKPSDASEVQPCLRESNVAQCPGSFNSCHPASRPSGGCDSHRDAVGPSVDPNKALLCRQGSAAAALDSKDSNQGRRRNGVAATDSIQSAKSIIQQSSHAGSRLPQSIFQPTSTGDLGDLWSKCRTAALQPKS